MTINAEKKHAEVVVSREYGKSQITHTVIHTERQIRIEMSLDDFLHELAQDIGPCLALTRAQLLAKLVNNAAGVIARMKESSKYGPLPSPEKKP